MELPKKKKKVCLIAEKKCLVVVSLKVTHRFSKFLTHFPQNNGTYQQ